MNKNVEDFFKNLTDKREKEEPQKERRNFLLKILTNRSFFVIHAYLYGVVNGFLIVIWLLSLQATGLTFFWPFHSLFGWGFVVGFHALTYFMYNDKSEYLTYLRQQSRYITFFAYHAFFYFSINSYLFLLNLIDLRFLWFTWSLGYWGILFVYHAIGFFTWNEIFKIQWKKLHPKYQEYSKNRLKTKIKYKIGNFWILLIHLTYFIVTFIIVYILLGTGIGEFEHLILMEIFLSWGVILAWHTFAYILYYYVGIITSVVKGLILHISIFATLNLQLFIDPEPYSIWHLYFVVLWAIAIIIHAVITLKWGNIVEKEQIKVRKQFDGSDTKRIASFWTAFSHEKVPIEEIPREEISQEISSFIEEDVRLIAKARLFWRWSLITHVIIYITGLIIIGITFSIQGIHLILLIHVIFGWLIGVAAHGALYYIVQKPIKGFFSYTAFLHLIIFIVTCTYLVILNILYTPRVPWSVIAILGWGIGIGIHLILMYATSKEVKEEEGPSISNGLLFWKWSFIIHLFIYIVVISIMGVSLIMQGDSLLFLIDDAMGWLIGLAAHGAIYYAIQKPIKGFFSYTAFVHLIIYIVTCTFLVILNVLFSPEFLWSIIVIGGWGIGMGFHIVLAYLTKKEDK